IETKAVNNVGMDSEATTIIYSVPNAPKPPIVTFLDPAVDPTVVYVSNYNVIAKVENVAGPSNITLTINGVPSTSFAYSTSSKLMTFTTSLLEGANVIQIKGTNDVGTDIESTTIVYKKAIQQAPPVVTITYTPVDNVVFTTPNIDVTATVLNVASASDIQVLVNGNPTTAFGFNTATKVLTLPLIMSEGNNTIQVTGTNTAGSDTKTRIIIYQKPAVPAPPTVVFVNPPSSPYVSSTQAYTVTANTTNISAKSQIVFKMNGSVIADPNYTLTSGGQVIYNSNLLDGNNIFEISVTNNDGMDEALALVTYDEPAIPCIIPTVGYISPVPYSTVTNPAVTIDAQINNFTAGTTVELKLNGVSQGYMTYNAGTSIATKAATLIEGSNAITVIVTNNCGTNMATFTLNYQVPNAPCTNPTVTAIGSVSQTTLATTASVTANTTGVTSSSNISVTVNGSSVPFTFDAGTGLVTVNNFNLSVGNNAVLITVSNTCGMAVLSYNIMRQVCNAPVIGSVNPANGSNTTNTTVTFTANVSNATAGEIILLVNGISQMFDYNETSDVLTASVNLNVGTNVISVSVTTPCGTDTELISVNREIPCEPLVTNLISPATSDLTITDQTYSILLNVSGSVNGMNLTATLNGAAVTAALDEITGNISLNNLNLVDGMNTVVVNMSNNCSNTSVTYHIQYNGCQPPVITITSVGNGATVNTSSLPFAASVLNSNGSANVQLLVNGSSVGFDFNDVSGLLSANILLNEGSNTITINVSGCQSASQTINVNYVIPCQNITSTLMQPYSNSQTVTESAYAITLGLQQVDNASQITVTQNGNAIPFSFDAGSGIVSINNITLVNGSNSIVVTATNQCSSETVSYVIQYNGCQPPVVTINSTQNAVSNSLFSFSASVTNISSQSDIQVLLNGAPVPFIFNSTNGSINAEINLTEGSNTITVNANGCQADSESLQITYTIPCSPISFALGTPATNNVSVADAVYAIELMAQNVNSSNIAVTVNGVSAPFSYNNDIISINGINLNPGANNVVVSMTNSCSSESVAYTITYNNCNTPVINLSSNSVTSSTQSYAFSAIVQHVSNQSQLSLTVNGANVPFTFAGGLVSANLNLNVGSNNIVLAANTCATASESINVVYTIPCYPVTYSLIAPAQLNTAVQGANTTISLAVENLDVNSLVGATLNGNAVPFTFSGNVVTLSNINLNAGMNTLVITISNNCSSETITYTIDSDQCETPTINLTSVNTNVNDPLFAFAAQIYNVNNSGDIQLLVNGTSVNFDFNAGTHNLTAQFSLQQGANTVTVNVNGCEFASATYTINYTIPCNPITYSLSSPSSNSATVTNENYQISLNTTNVASQSNIGVLLNGNAIPFSFSGSVVSINGIVLQPGVNTITVTLTNDCSSETVTYSINYNAPAPCQPPVINVTSVNATDDQSYNLTATVSNIDNGSQITVTLNGVPVAASYNASSDILTAAMTLVNGNNTIGITANGCEVVSTVYAVNYTPAPPPCNPPVVTVTSSNSVTNAVYNLTATITNMDSPSGISVTLNGSPVAASYNTGTDQLTATLNLVEGNNTVQITANGCAVGNGSITVNYDAPDCGTRINPGNSQWEFCLVTPGATYTRDNLANDINFTYSGPATSLFCKPIAGGGDAIVNGQPYAINVGQYYLFTGNLIVSVANDNPNAMGHWEVCIQSDTEPVYGNGGNRPTSPCEAPPCDAPVINFTSQNT
ncbi:MAG: hypothetical protein JNJ99_09795, partial [Crocinitomicaceae bacterium]|nr:hypothetical protein [Crocinitomicaceae bacterium]